MKKQISFYDKRNKRLELYEIKRIIYKSNNLLQLTRNFSSDKIIKGILDLQLTFRITLLDTAGGTSFDAMQRYAPI